MIATAARFLVAGTLAVGLTVAIFYFMHRLVAMGEAELEPSVQGRVVDFVRVKREPVVTPKKREMPNRPPDMEAPPPMEMDFSSPTTTENVGEALSIAAPTPELALELKGPSIGGRPSSDADAAPLVRVEPVYPTTAAAEGIEGWVRIQFDIGTTGQVQNARVVGAEPPRVFDKAALRAVQKWKYRPTVENGKPVVKRGVVVKLTFEL